MAFSLSLTFQPYGGGAAWTIEVMSAEFDGVQTLNIGSQPTSAGAGRVTFDALRFTKRPDGHSADLWGRLCSGTPFQKVTLGVTGAGEKAPYFTFTMGLVGLKTLAFAATPPDSPPLETVLLEYGQAAYSVAVQNPDGTMGKAEASGWDRVKNVSIDPAKVGA